MNRTKTAMGTVAVRAAVIAALAGLAAGCSSSPPSVSASPPPATPASTAPMNTASASASASAAASAPASAPASANGSASASSPGAAAGFVPIVEPFDPGHPARTQPPPAADCYNLESTVDIEQCFQVKTENTDAEIDAVQEARYASASPAGRAAILAQDRAWLSARGPVCELAFHTGGSIDIISTSACLLAESTARLNGVKGIAAPEARLKITDSLDPNVWSWYTTPEGSRIAAISTQGDQTGGGIIGWIVIGGADGFVINPAQFYFVNGSYVNYGFIEPPNPTYHRVGTGHEYQFDIDYTNLSHAPGNPAAGGFVYAPGVPVAFWG